MRSESSGLALVSLVAEALGYVEALDVALLDRIDRVIATLVVLIR